MAPSVSDGLHTFADAMTRDTPVITGSILLFLALFQTINVNMSIKKDEHRCNKAVYAITISMMLFQVVRAALVKTNQITPGSATLVAVSLGIVVLVGFLAQVSNRVTACLFGPKTILLVCWFLLYVAVSGDELAGRPDAITISVMVIAAAVGAYMIYHRQHLEVLTMAFTRAFIVSFTLVYTAEYVYPYVVDMMSGFYAVRRFQATYSHEKHQEGFENSVNDLMNFRRCSSAYGCVLRVAVVVVLTSVGTYRTYKKNKPTGELEQHRMLAEQVVKERNQEVTDNKQLADLSSSR